MPVRSSNLSVLRRNKVNIARNKSRPPHWSAQEEAWTCDERTHARTHARRPRAESLDGAAVRENHVQTNKRQIRGASANRRWMGDRSELNGSVRRPGRTINRQFIYVWFTRGDPMAVTYLQSDGFGLKPIRVSRAEYQLPTVTRRLGVQQIYQHVSLHIHIQTLCYSDGINVRHYICF